MSMLSQGCPDQSLRSGCPQKIGNRSGQPKQRNVRSRQSFSGREHVGEANRKAGKKGGFQGFALPENERIRIFSLGEAIDGHAVVHLIDDPVLRDAEPLVEPELLLPVTDHRFLGEDFHHQIRNSLGIPLGNDGSACVGHKDQIRLDDLQRIGGLNRVAGGRKIFPIGEPALAMKFPIRRYRVPKVS